MPKHRITNTGDVTPIGLPPHSVVNPGQSVVVDNWDEIKDRETIVHYVKSGVLTAEETDETDEQKAQREAQEALAAQNAAADAKALQQAQDANAEQAAALQQQADELAKQNEAGKEAAAQQAAENAAKEQAAATAKPATGNTRRN